MTTAASADSVADSDYYKMATALEQLRYIDEQLEKAALPPDQAELVRVHRLTGLQLRSQRMSGEPCCWLLSSQQPLIRCKQRGVQSVWMALQRALLPNTAFSNT